MIQYQYTKMLWVDIFFEISIFNDQMTNVILEFQSSKGKEGRLRLVDSLMGILIRAFVFIIQSAHCNLYAEEKQCK